MKRWLDVNGSYDVELEARPAKCFYTSFAVILAIFGAMPAGDS